MPNGKLPEEEEKGKVDSPAFVLSMYLFRWCE